MNFVAKASRISVAASAGRGRRRCQSLTSTLIYYQQSFSSSAAPRLNPKDSASRDKRMAGRLRFYKTVDVEPVPAPWEASVSTSDSKKESIDSPISAGVDDSQSATGIQHSTPETKHNIQKMLLPKQPGTNAAGDENSTSWYGITLDGRLLKSPMNQTLAVPSQNLAYAIAAEWDAQAKYLQPAQMPLMTLSCTALDQAAEFPEGYREQSLNYLPTDTTCFWADPMEDRVLHRRQEQAWKKLHDFTEQRLNHAPSVALGSAEAMLMTRKRANKPSTGLPHPSGLLEQAEQWTSTLDAWHLVALHSICMQAKSFLVAMALLEAHGTADCPFDKNMEKALEASRVEEEFQIAIWGLVEGGHDYDRLNCSVQLHSAQLMTKMIAMDNNLLS